jgi:exopolysaccharide biosynthesis WecB/TagA/CpsF family protein
MVPCDNHWVTTHRNDPDRSSGRPLVRRPVAFISWGAIAGRPAEIAAALGGDHRCFFPKGSARRPPAPARYVLSAVGTALYLWRRRPRVVIVTNPPVPGAWFTARCARSLGAAVIIDSHPGGFGAQGDGVAARMQRIHERLVRHADAVIVTDESWSEQVRAWGGKPLIVHEAPGTAGIAPRVPGTTFQVLVVGTFNRDEPVAAVLEAAAATPDCDFVLTGDPSKCPAALLAAVPPNVRLAGFLDPASYRSALEACDAVMALTTEPTSVMRAAYEAIYARRPLIVSDWPVARRLFPYAMHATNQPYDLAAAVDKMRSDHSHFSALVDLAYAQQHARWEKQLRSLTDVVTAALDESSRRHALAVERSAVVVLDGLEGQAVVRHIVSSAANGVGGRMANVNVDTLRQALASPRLRQQINECDLVLADGVPIVWTTRLQGTPVPERVSASEMIWPMCEEAARSDVGVFLLGGAPGAAARSAARLGERFPGLQIDHLCPPLGFERSASEMAAITWALSARRPGIVFCAFGAPKQEHVMSLLAGRFPSTWFVACGGTFEMVCGDLPQAPRWMRKSALEWAHRLRLEPRRLFQRYVVRDIPFAAKLFAVTALASLGAPTRAILEVRPKGTQPAGRPQRLAVLPSAVRSLRRTAPEDLVRQVREANRLSASNERALSIRGSR